MSGLKVHAQKRLEELASTGMFDVAQVSTVKYTINFGVDEWLKRYVSNYQKQLRDAEERARMEAYHG